MKNKMLRDYIYIIVSIFLILMQYIIHDILILIFKLRINDLFHIELTCKTFHHIIYKYDLWILFSRYLGIRRTDNNFLAKLDIMIFYKYFVNDNFYADIAKVYGPHKLKLVPNHNIKLDAEVEKIYSENTMREYIEKIYSENTMRKYIFYIGHIQICGVGRPFICIKLKYKYILHLINKSPGMKEYIINVEKFCLDENIIMLVEDTHKIYNYYNVTIINLENSCLRKYCKFIYTSVSKLQLIIDILIKLTNDTEQYNKVKW